MTQGRVSGAKGGVGCVAGRDAGMREGEPHALHRLISAALRNLTLVLRGAAPPRNIHLPVLPPSAGVLPAPFPEDPPTTVRPVAARDRPRPRPGPRRGACLGGRAPGGHRAGLILQAPVRRAARILGSGAEGGGQWRYFAPAVRGRGSRLVESAASGGCCSSRVDLEGRLVSWRELKMNKKKRWKRLSIPGIWKRHRRWTWAVRKSFDRLRFDGPGSLPLRQHLISKGLGLIACCSSPSNSPVPEKFPRLIGQTVKQTPYPGRVRTSGGLLWVEETENDHCPSHCHDASCLCVLLPMLLRGLSNGSVQH